MTARTRPLVSTLMILALIAFFSTAASAGGSQEQATDHHHDDHHHEADHHHDDHDDHDHHHDDHHHDDHHHDGVMAIPHISPVSLGAGERLRVIASTSIIGDVVGQVAGTAADVTVLMPIGQNPHAYQPTPRAMGQVERGHVVFVNGLDLEEGLMDAIDRIATGYVVPVSAGITVLGVDDDHDDHHDHDHDDHHDDHHDHDHDHAHGDPHFWFSPRNVIVWTENIAHALSHADPANNETYRANAAAYIAELEALDLEIRTKVNRIPRAERKLVADHVALTYFAADYGFEIIGEVVPGTSDQVEPSARHIADLSRAVRDQDIRAIFVGGTANRGLRNLVQTVAAETGRDIHIGEILTGSLTPAGSRGDTYLDFMRYNAEQITGALAR